MPLRQRAKIQTLPRPAGSRTSGRGRYWSLVEGARGGRGYQADSGRPIISAKLNDHQMVALGNTIHFSKSWKAFPDFLADYIKKKMGPEWGNAELAKPLAERHPLMHWYDAYCRYQKETIETRGEVNSAEIIGVVACYLGLVYAVYLLAHNVEVQDRLIKRLKNTGNFQGAYYELMVASTLIRAGFKLTLEDETDPGAKHCEFAAVSETNWPRGNSRRKRGIEARQRRRWSTISIEPSSERRIACVRARKDSKPCFGAGFVHTPSDPEEGICGHTQSCVRVAPVP
jgi:hypothetical protein